MVTINKLCELYRSDKCPAIGHSYAPKYDEIFNDKRDAERVLELGAGAVIRMKRYIPGYKMCASLYVWRDYFPKAEIYGLDFELECENFEEDRMTVIVGDQHKQVDLQKLVTASGKKFDIIIDDCSHLIDDQIFSANFLLPHLQDDGIYCIEDIYDPEINFPLLKRLFKDYEVETFEFTPNRNDCLAIIRKRA